VPAPLPLFIDREALQMYINFAYVSVRTEVFPMGANWIRRGYGSSSGVPRPCNLVKMRDNYKSRL